MTQSQLSKFWLKTQWIFNKSYAVVNRRCQFWEYLHLLINKMDSWKEQKLNIHYHVWLKTVIFPICLRLVMEEKREEK